MEITLKNDQELVIDGKIVTAKNIVIRDKWRITEARDGDIIVNGTDVLLFKDFYDDKILYYAICRSDDDFEVHTDGEYGITELKKNDVHLANKDDAGLLMYYLETHRYEWNAGEKKMTHLAWKPKMGESYYFVEVCAQLRAEIRCKTYQASDYDEKNIEYGNYFKNEQLAHQAAETLKVYIKDGLSFNKRNLPNE